MPAAAILTRVSEPSDAVKSRVRQAELELDKAHFLQLPGGPKPKAQVRNAIKQHEARARRLLREAEELARAEGETQWLAQALAESVLLAVARGEDVGEQPVAGTKARRVLMLSRGMGLEHARDNGYLAGAAYSRGGGRDQTDDLYNTGVAYRTAYELVDGKLSKRGEGSGGFGPSGPQVRLAEAGQALRVMRGGLTRKQRDVLDAVCGEGLGMFEASKACRIGTPAARNALRGGLEAALGAMRAASKAKEPVDVAGDLERAYDAVAAAGRGL